MSGDAIFGEGRVTPWEPGPVGVGNFDKVDPAQVALHEANILLLEARLDEFQARFGKDVETEYLAYRPTVRLCLELVSNKTRFSIFDLVGQNRNAQLARARHIACWLARKVTGKSLPEIGKVMGGRDHTTILHAVREIERLRDVDGEIRRLTDDLLLLFQGAVQ